jgi:hypothetical protein
MNGAIISTRDECNRISLRDYLYISIDVSHMLLSHINALILIGFRTAADDPSLNLYLALNRLTTGPCSTSVERDTLSR